MEENKQEEIKQEENKKSNVGKIVIIVIICLLVGAGGFFVGKEYFSKENNNKENEKTEEKKTPEETTTEEPTTAEETSSEYKVYSTIDNQGWYESVVGYKGNLYYIAELEKGLCKEKMTSSVLSDYDECADEEDDDDEEERSTGSYSLMNVLVKDVKNAQIYQSYRSDGASNVFVIFKDGKVNRFEFVDKGNEEKNIFNGYNVKKISKYECSKYGEEGCDKEKFTLLLEDDSTKTIEK